MSHQLPSKYLLEMPRSVLFGQAKVIERWLTKGGKARPTLLDLSLARRAMGKKR